MQWIIEYYNTFTSELSSVKRIDDDNSRTKHFSCILCVILENYHVE